MINEAFIQDAVDLLDSYQVPEEYFTEALINQIRLMTGQGWEYADDFPVVEAPNYQQV